MNLLFNGRDGALSRPRRVQRRNERDRHWMRDSDRYAGRDIAARCLSQFV